MMHAPRTRNPREQGFTLVVIAALFIAFAVIGAAAVERNTTAQQITRRTATAEQLTRLSNAIIEYSVFNRSGTTNIYPCPARYDLDPSNASFGISYTGCYNTAPTASGGVVLTAGSTDILRGMVPVQTLSQYGGINVNDAFDPWNNRIMYIVNRQMTSALGTPVKANNPTVTEVTTSQTIAAPDFILVSYGRDGVGAYKRVDTTVAIGCAAASTERRLENCDNDIAFNQGPTYTATNATTTTYFDDILSYYRQ
ncbi:MAG: hypothetical protein V4735_03130 [Pseudomonadota bacterium]